MPSPPQRTGLLSMLDVECGLRGTAETYLQKVRAAHRSSGRLRDPPPGEPGTFAIQHYAGLVVYSAEDFLGEQEDEGEEGRERKRKRGERERLLEMLWNVKENADSEKESTKEA